MNQHKEDIFFKMDKEVENQADVELKVNTRQNEWQQISRTQEKDLGW